jgi:aminoglycoside 2'-N-acetyltransferase I
VNEPAVAVYDVATMPADLRSELEAWFDRQFGHLPFQWTPPEWYVVARLDGQLVGRLSVARREISVGGTRVDVGGVAGVTTLPELRRRGIAAAMMRRTATLFRDELAVAFGHLLCRADIAPVYASVGWERVAVPTWFTQRSGRQRYPHETMILRCAGQPWPEGEIDLGGLPW